MSHKLKTCPPFSAAGVPLPAGIKKGMPEGIPRITLGVRRGSPALASRLAFFSLHHNGYG